MFFRPLIYIFIVLLFSSTALGQAKPTKYGEMWSQLNNNEKYLYLTGYSEGLTSFQVASLLATSSCKCDDPKEIGMNRIQRVARTLRVEFDLETVGKVMTDIYKDPANVFIPFAQTVTLAVDKLRGKNIDGDIIRMRKSVIEAYEFTRKKN